MGEGQARPVARAVRRLSEETRADLWERIDEVRSLDTSLEVELLGMGIDDLLERRGLDLHATGLLWLINRTTFHSRGFALALNPLTREFSLLGDGSEPWSFDPATIDEDGAFQRVEALFAQHRAPSALASSPGDPHKPGGDEASAEGAA